MSRDYLFILLTILLHCQKCSKYQPFSLHTLFLIFNSFSFVSPPSFCFWLPSFFPLCCCLEWRSLQLPLSTPTFPIKPTQSKPPMSQQTIQLTNQPINLPTKQAIQSPAQDRSIVV